MSHMGNDGGRTRAFLARLAKALVMALGALVGLLALALIAVQTPWVGSWIGDRVEDRASALVAGTIALDRLDIDGTTIEIGGLSIHDPAGALAARVDRVLVDLSLLPLLRRQVHVERLVIDRPWVGLAPRSPRRGLLAALRPTGSPEREQRSRWSLELERLVLCGGALEAWSGARPEPAEPATFRLVQIAASGQGRYRAAGSEIFFALQLHGQSTAAAAGALELDLRGSGQQRLDQGRGHIRLGDTLSAQARISGHSLVIGVDRARLTPGLARLWTPGWPLVKPLAAHGQVRVGPADFQGNIQVQVVGGDGTASIGGSVTRSFDRSPTGLVLRMQEVSPAALLGRGPDTPIKLSAAIAAGSLDADRLSGSLTVDALPALWRGHPWGPVSLSARLDLGRLVRLDGRLALPGARLTLHDGGDPGGSGAPAWARGRLRLHSLQRTTSALAALLGTDTPGLRGAGWVRFTILGDPLPKPLASGIRIESQLRALAVGGVRPGEVHLMAVIPPSAVEGRRFRLVAAVQRPVPIRLLLAGQRISGGAADRLDLKLERLRLAYPGGAGRRRWRLTGDARLRVAPPAFSITDLVLVSGRQRVALELERSQRELSGRLLLSRVRLASLPRALARRAGQPRGRLDGGLRLDGSAARPRLHAQIRLAEGSWRSWRGLAGRVDAHYRRSRADGGLSLSAHDLDLGARFDLPARWPPPAKESIDVDARVTGVRLNQLLPARGVLLARGQLAARVRVGGTTSAPVLDAHAELDQLHREPVATASGAGAVPFSGSGQLQLRYRERELSGHLALRDREGGALQGEATIPVDLSPRRLAVGRGLPAVPDLSIVGHLRARGVETAWLAALVGPLRQMRGRMYADLQVGGTLGSPDLGGRLGLRQGRAVVIPRRRP
jgi:hypothetical protein